ncbi:MAG: hypothetical protein EBS41_06915 [Actinobacteria bacterium]|nr:hypothetical protein [Actinomycetota bacterium]
MAIEPIMTRQDLSLSLLRDMLMTVALLFGLIGPAVAQTNIAASLAAESQSPKAGSTVLLAIDMQPKPGWHGYWRNPGDAGVGVGIVRRAVVEPLRWIAENAGQQGYVVVQKVAEQPTNHGYNAATDVYEDLVAAGVIDPVKVTRSALQNAASIAAMLLTTEVLVVEKKEESEDESSHGHGHSHGH